MSKYVKELIIDDVHARLGDARDVLVIDSSALDPVADHAFRGKIRNAGVKMLTVKNTLARKALEKNGVTGMEKVLAGPSTIIYGGEDVVALSKVVVKITKDYSKITIKGGSVEGTTLSGDAVTALSKSPGRLELISQIAGQILSPGAKLAGALLGPGGKLAGIVKTIEEKHGGGDEPSSEAA
ncbi:50S ribosomal protein L10 [Lacunimicrobium album]